MTITSKLLQFSDHPLLSIHQEYKAQKVQNFNYSKFCHEFYQILIMNGSIYQTYNPHHKLTEDFPDLETKHAPLISKATRGNQALFMNKELGKLIMEKI